MKHEPKVSTFVGMFTNEWNNPPKPFNPAYDPKAAGRSKAVSSSMEAGNYYATHTRAECAAEWRRRYDAEKEAGR